MPLDAPRRYVAVATLVAAALFPDPGHADLKDAIAAVERGDLARAGAEKASLDRVEQIIVDWLAVRFGNPALSSQAITRFALTYPTWPDPELFRRRAEQALERENPPPEKVIQAFAGSRPYSNRGRILLARALLATGRRDQALEHLRTAWRDSKLSDGEEAEILKEFGALLSKSDHKARLDAALLTNKGATAARIAKFIGPEWERLAQARLAIEAKKPNAAQLLDSLPGSMQGEPAYIFARAQLARRGDQWQDAARWLLQAPRDPVAMVVPDEWWEERRIVSRKLLDLGDPRTAYRLAAAHTGSTPAAQAEADFHAGWYALRFLNEPSTAMKHFAHIAEASTRPISLARSYYWMARAAEAGAGGPARELYAKAASFGFTFYGQVARAKLGYGDLGIDRNPTPSSADRAAFERDDRVTALKKLAAIGRRDLAGTFYKHIAETTRSAGEAALLIGLAESQGWHHVAVQTGKAALHRGLDVEVLAYPLRGLPDGFETNGLERAMVFAISRQESEFNPEVVSTAGARGIFQVMPETGRHAAKLLGETFVLARLIPDRLYNLKLGTRYVAWLLSNYDGNYIMAIAGYNAGPGRIRDWVKLYGDPRDPKVDPIDWIERIPFSETRNYVQRVLENLQIYRFRLEGRGLMIASDLARGRETRTTGTVQPSAPTLASPAFAPTQN